MIVLLYHLCTTTTLINIFFAFLKGSESFQSTCMINEELNACLLTFTKIIIILRINSLILIAVVMQYRKL